MVDPLEAKLGSRARVLLPIAILLFLGLSAWRMWPRGGDDEVVKVEGPTMGTTFAVTVVGDGDEEAIAAAITRELALVDETMSNYRADSEITRFNRHRSADPFPLSPAMAEVLTIAAEVSELSGGAFDVTIPPLLAAWGFGPRPAADPTPPSPEALRALRERVGHQLLGLDGAARTATKRHPALEIDLSAIAPGYAADRIADALTQLGHRDFMVDVGGEIRVKGRNAAGQRWRIGVERPAATRGDPPALQEVVALDDEALATSGDYRSYREVDGRRISHSIDPRSGRPIEHALASVTVVHADAAHADALATAINVLGPAEGRALAERIGLPVLLILRQPDGSFTVEASAAFEALRAREGSATLGRP